MKIGILTYHRSHNYGALLQAIALREVLVRQGHQVTFIDYWPAYHRHMNALFSFPWMMSRGGLKGKLNYLRECIKNYCSRKTRKSNFETFISDYIEPYTTSMNESYDIIVHGSDQIWRKQPEINKYNPVYFGQHEINARRRISYAASMGILPKKESDKRVLKELLSHLDAISVRESGLKNLVEELGYAKVNHDLDPTLLLPENFWVKTFGLKNSNERYAVYYMLNHSFELNEIRSYINAKGLKLIVIRKPTLLNVNEQETTLPPEKFLQLFYGAKMIFTSSFHGLAFSLIFHKQFYASFARTDRALSLLSLVGLEDRLVSPHSKLPNDDNVIDFNKIEKKIQNIRDKSLNHLKVMCASDANF